MNTNNAMAKAIAYLLTLDKKYDSFDAYLDELEEVYLDIINN